MFLSCFFKTRPGALDGATFLTNFFLVPASALLSMVYMCLVSGWCEGEWREVVFFFSFFLCEKQQGTAASTNSQSRILHFVASSSEF